MPNSLRHAAEGTYSACAVFLKSIWEVQVTRLLGLLGLPGLLELLGLLEGDSDFFFFEIDLGSQGYQVTGVTGVTGVTRVTKRRF